MPQSKQEKNRKIYERRTDRSTPFASAFKTNSKIILATQSTCALCGGIVDKTLKAPDPMSASIDHIIPVSRGGHPSDMSNLQLTHRVCNRRKGTKIITDKVEIENVFIHSRDWKND